MKKTDGYEHPIQPVREEGQRKHENTDEMSREIDAISALRALALPSSGSGRFSLNEEDSHGDDSENEYEDEDEDEDEDELYAVKGKDSAKKSNFPQKVSLYDYLSTTV